VSHTLFLRKIAGLGEVENLAGLEGLILVVEKAMERENFEISLATLHERASKVFKKNSSTPNKLFTFAQSPSPKYSTTEDFQKGITFFCSSSPFFSSFFFFSFFSFPLFLSRLRKLDFGPT
jgi:hypothetical protein